MHKMRDAPLGTERESALHDAIYATLCILQPYLFKLAIHLISRLLTLLPQSPNSTA